MFSCSCSGPNPQDKKYIYFLVEIQKKKKTPDLLAFQNCKIMHFDYSKRPSMWLSGEESTSDGFTGDAGSMPGSG